MNNWLASSVCLMLLSIITIDIDRLISPFFNQVLKRNSVINIRTIARS